MAALKSPDTICPGKSILYSENHRGVDVRYSALRLAAQTFWRMPGRFGIARLFGPSYSLRCVVFHDVSTAESPFTRGMRVNATPTALEAALSFLTKHYSPVSLEEILADADSQSLPPRAVLVTFDDGYASAINWAAPLCKRFGVPAVFFLNAAFLDNHHLAPDNLICFVANELGMETINAAARVIKGTDSPRLNFMADVFSRFFPAISLAERATFLDALAHLGGINEGQLAEEARLYLTCKQVRELASLGFEIGNHTYTHIRCRSLTREELGGEVDRNKAELESISGKSVRSFSVPYGSSEDLSSDLVGHLKLSGHEVAFLSESAANLQGADKFQFDRVSMHANSDDSLFFQIEVLPRLRTTRNRFNGH
jgi:peptidoglycan/xylan/chitin deacetylase (PgdA/CDA1 family)